MQARRRAQPSGTNSPSSSHPRSKHRARCAIFRPCPPCGRQGRPGQGFLAGSNIRAAGERPPRARPQRRGSPGPIPNPAVKPAFAESTAARGCGRAGRRARGGRFSFRAQGRRRRAGRGPQGGSPLRASSRLGGTPEGAFPRPGGSTDGGTCVTSANRGAGGPPGGASLPGGPSFGRCAPARFCAVCAPCNQSWCFRWLSLRGGLVGGRLSFVMRRFPIRIFCWSPKALMWTIISKLYTIHWRNAGVGDCASC